MERINRTAPILQILLLETVAIYVVLSLAYLYLAIVHYKIEGRKLLWKNMLSCTMTSVVHGIGACLVGDKPQKLTLSVGVAITLYHLFLYLLILYQGCLRNFSCDTSVLVLPIVALETDRAGSEEETLGRPR